MSHATVSLLHLVQLAAPVLAWQTRLSALHRLQMAVLNTILCGLG